jgi:N-acetyl-anhydromuramyl-L-alanine amidase AmpD
MANGDYPTAAFYGADPANYTAANRPYSDLINKIIIHVTQGAWAGALNWFTRPIAQASAHYVVRSSDGFVGQSVREKDIAWHSGNWLYNQTSIGIEHEGYFGQTIRTLQEYKEELKEEMSTATEDKPQEKRSVKEG